MPEDYDYEDDVFDLADDDMPRHASALRLAMRFGGHHTRRKAREELERMAEDRAYTCAHWHSKLRGDLCGYPDDEATCPCGGDMAECGKAPADDR